MNKLKNFMTWLLLLAASHVMAINVTVDAIEIEPGKTAQLVINLNNSENDLTAYQMFLYLPDGVTVQKKANGKYAYTTNGDRHDGAFTVSVKDAEGGGLLITCFSADKDVITGTSGHLQSDRRLTGGLAQIPPVQEPLCTKAFPKKTGGWEVNR